MTEVIDDEKVREDADKIVKIHSYIEKLLPDRDVFIDIVNGNIEWNVKFKNDGKWKSN